MRNKIGLSKLEKGVIVYLAIIMFVGVIGHISFSTRELMLKLTPLALLLNGVITLYFSGIGREKKYYFVVGGIFLSGLIIEIIGVNTKVIFGDYEYGVTLGIKVFDTPLIIGLNWVIVVLGGYSVVSVLKMSNVKKVLLTAIIATIFDFFVEPVAIKLRYWHWNSETIPLQNYIAWFVFTAILTTILLKTDVTGKQYTSNIFPFYLAMQLFFFIFLQLGL